MDNKELLARITVLEREVEQLNSRLAKLEKKMKEGWPHPIPLQEERGLQTSRRP